MSRKVDDSIMTHLSLYRILARCCSNMDAAHFWPIDFGADSLYFFFGFGQRDKRGVSDRLRASENFAIDRRIANGEELRCSFPSCQRSVTITLTYQRRPQISGPLSHFIQYLK